ncbi:predicted protein [Nematostella vectensis]|uniref:Uncharacterized protein n=1 Tax=Nematostella vectensis TaxID=45351 RepID=A7STJ4_NEMVE|nr:predicted protein [Nematostella vectensis]|eukprot:XP_001625052.1 predicted protein [Nematostella vectensis]
MLKMYALRVSIVVFVGLLGNIHTTKASASKENNTYIILAPNQFRPGMVYTIKVSILKSSAKVNVTAEIASETKSLIENTAVFSQGNTGNLDLKVPFNEAVSSENYYLTVNGSGGLEFSEKSYVRFRENGFSLNIQTDKGVYKPGQTGPKYEQNESLGGLGRSIRKEKRINQESKGKKPAKRTQKKRIVSSPAARRDKKLTLSQGKEEGKTEHQDGNKDIWKMVQNILSKLEKIEEAIVKANSTTAETNFEVAKIKEKLANEEATINNSISNMIKNNMMVFKREQEQFLLQEEQRMSKALNEVGKLQGRVGSLVEEKTNLTKRIKSYQ